MKGIRILVVILCACFVSAAWGQQQVCTAHTPWGQFHRSNMERWNPCEHLLSVNNVGSLSRKWSYTTRGGVRSAPAVVNGVVYLTSFDGNLYALDARTGTKLWSYSGNFGGCGGYCGTTPSAAVVNGVLYIGSFDNNVYALNAHTGVKLWSYTTGSGVDSSPAVVDGWFTSARVTARCTR